MKRSFNPDDPREPASGKRSPGSQREAGMGQAREDHRFCDKGQNHCQRGAVWCGGTFQLALPGEIPGKAEKPGLPHLFFFFKGEK